MLSPIICCLLHFDLLQQSAFSYLGQYGKTENRKIIKGSNQGLHNSKMINYSIYQGEGISMNLPFELNNHISASTN